MQIGLVGLGRMGMNMGRRWLKGGHEVVAFNRTIEKAEELATEGAIAAGSLTALVEHLKAPRLVWLMLPTGAVVDQHVEELAERLSPGDIVIDGGNTYYKDDIRHAEFLKTKGIRFMDAGVSGGIWGLKNGYCTMVGGAQELFQHIEPVLKTLAPKDGYLHCGGVGAGHFIKMIHNGIEYGLMQAYAEGFEIIEASPYKTDLQKVSHLWNRGSVVRSWLPELAEEAFAQDPSLGKISGYVEDSGEGRWMVQQAIETGVAAPVITQSVYQRSISREKDPFGFRVLAALRNQFGGHAVVKAGENKRQAIAGAVQAAIAAPDAQRAGFR